MAKQYRYTFTVEGKGQFAMDMLRFDCCWPATSEDAVKLAPDLRNRSVLTEARKVTLCSIRQPTDGRWASFGWKVHSDTLSRREL